MEDRILTERPTTCIWSRVWCAIGQVVAMEQALITPSRTTVPQTITKTPVIALSPSLEMLPYPTYVHPSSMSPGSVYEDGRDIPDRGKSAGSNSVSAPDWYQPTMPQTIPMVPYTELETFDSQSPPPSPLTNITNYILQYTGSTYRVNLGHPIRV